MNPSTASTPRSPRTRTLAAACALVLVLGLAACKLESVPLYDGIILERSQEAIVTSIGGDPATFTGIQVTAIDGRDVPAAAYEYRLRAGPHQVKLHVTQGPLRRGATHGSTVFIDLTLDVTLEAGHTYEPMVELAAQPDDDVFHLLDRGKDFPESCSPLLLAQAKRPIHSCDDAASARPAP